MTPYYWVTKQYIVQICVMNSNKICDCLLSARPLLWLHMHKFPLKSWAESLERSLCMHDCFRYLKRLSPQCIPSMISLPQCVSVMVHSSFSCACVNSVYQALSPMFWAPGNEANSGSPQPNDFQAMNAIQLASFPGPCPAFRRLQYRKAGEGQVHFLTWVTSRVERQ